MTDMTVSETAVQAPAEWRDYRDLLKPRVMSLVVFTGLVGMMVAPGGIHPVIGFAALLAIAVGAGAAGALNQWYEAELDAKMTRTQNRPLPQGKLPREEALTFGLILSVLSVLSMGVMVNWLAASLLALTIVFYAVVYTMWLKPRTPQNIVIGGAAGALPPVIGWAAASGTVSGESIALFAIIFLWTPPHFWALALNRQTDYAAAGVPMLPNVAGEAATRRQIGLYALLYVASSFAPVVMGFGGVLYGAAAVGLGAWFLMPVVQLWRAGDSEAPVRRKLAGRIFGLSILHLFGLFAALLAETAIGWIL